MAQLSLLLLQLQEKTFENVAHWVDELRLHSGNPELPVVMIGNKNDLVLERVVTTLQGEEFAKM